MWNVSGVPSPPETPEQHINEGDREISALFKGSADDPKGGCIEEGREDEDLTQMTSGQSTQPILLKTPVSSKWN